MLRYSYNVVLKELQALKAGLELDLFNNPNNKRAKERLDEVNQEIIWHQERLPLHEKPEVI